MMLVNNTTIPKIKKQQSGKEWDQNNTQVSKLYRKQVHIVIVKFPNWFVVKYQ